MNPLLAQWINVLRCPDNSLVDGHAKEVLLANGLQMRVLAGSRGRHVNCPLAFPNLLTEGADTQAGGYWGS